jgi:hypothetical protein
MAAATGVPGTPYDCWKPVLPLIPGSTGILPVLARSVKGLGEGLGKRGQGAATPGPLSQS